MKMLKGATKLEAVCPGVGLTQFRHIRELRFVIEDQGDDEQVINAYLTIARDDNGIITIASLFFRDVKDIRIRDLNPPDMHVPGFDVVCVKDRAWERINFEVLDYEEDYLHFYARDAEVVEVVWAQ